MGLHQLEDALNVCVIEHRPLTEFYLKYVGFFIAKVQGVVRICFTFGCNSRIEVGAYIYAVNRYWTFRTLIKTNNETTISFLT